MPPMPRVALRTYLTTSGLVAVATAALTVACSVVTKVDFTECAVSDECRGAFGLGWVCGDAGLCEEVEAVPRCKRVFPEDLFTNETYRDAIVFGSLFDHNTEDGDLKLVNAASLAIDEANASGLTDGRLYGIVHCDYQENTKIDALTSEEATVATARHLVDELGAVAIIGPGYSSLAETVFKELQKPEHDPTAVVISPSATSDSLTDIDVRDGDKPGLFWRTAPPDGQLGANLAGHMTSENIASATVIYTNDSYGSGLAKALQKNFAGDLQLLAFTTQDDILAHVQTVSKKTPGDTVGVVFFASEVSQATAFLNAAKPFSFYSMSRIYFGDAAYNKPFLDGTKEAASLYPQVRGVISGNPSGDNFDSFVSRYLAVFKEDPTDASYSSQTYDATWLAVYGTAWAEYQRKGELTGLNLAFGLQRISDTKGVAVDISRDGWNVVKREFKAGHSINVTGASGDLQYDPETEETTAKVVYWKINDTGTDFENVP